MHTKKRWEALVLSAAVLFGATVYMSAQTTTPQSSPPVITGPATISAETGKAMSVAFTATNSPNQYAIRGGTVPPGLHMDLMLGKLEGSPTAAGTYKLDVAAANSGTSGSQWSATFTTTITITVGSSTPTTPAEITGPSSVTAQVGTAFSATITTTRAASHYEIRSGAIPPGVGVDTLGGTIKGTPTAAGTFTLEMVAVSQGSTGQQYSAPYSIKISISADGTTPPPAGAPVPVITGPSTASGEVGKPFSLTYTATNSPTSWHIESGSTPPGTQMDLAAGTIKGTPTQAGTFRLDVVAHNISSGVTQSSARYSTTITITLAPASTPPPTTSPTPSAPPEITGPFSASGKVGQAFSLIVSARNNPTQFAIRGGTPPQGLIIDMGSTLVFRGTPTQVGTFSLTVVAGNNGASGVQWSAPATITITIADADGYPAPVITGPFSATGTVGRAFSLTFTATNKPLAFVIQGPTPPAIKLDSFGGILSGTPTEVGTSTFNVIAENAGPNGMRQWSAPVAVTITINADSTTPPPPPPPPSNPNAPVITSAAEASGQTGQAFSFTLTASNSPTQFAIRSGTLQPGLSLDAATGKITGTPQLAGTASLSVAAANSGPNGAVWGEVAALRITIVTGPASAPPVISGPATASGTVGQYFSMTFNTSNQPRVYEIRGGAVPPGLHMDLMAGVIVGTPTQAGVFKLDVAASNQGVSGSQWSAIFSTVITIAPVAVAVPVATTGTPPTTTAGAGTTAPAPTGTTAPTLLTPTGTLAGAPTGVTTAPTPTSTPGSISPTTTPTTTATAPTTTPTTTTTVSTVTASTTANIPTTSTTPAAAGKTPQSITVSVPVAKEPDAAPFAVSASSSAGLPVTLEVVSGPAVVRDNVVALNGDTGMVTVRAAQSGTAEIAAAEVTRSFMVSAADSSQLANISARMEVSETDPGKAFITGFVIAGERPRRILVRAIGPALARFGVERVLTNPRLQLTDSTGRLVAENDDWRDDGLAAIAGTVGAFPLQAGEADAAVVLSLPPGAYSMRVMTNGGSGVALAEVFDAENTSANGTRVVNMSTRGFVGRGESLLTTGFVITGSAPKRVLIRAAGPALSLFNVTDVLVDPVLTLYRGSTILAQNDDWETVDDRTAGQRSVSPEDIVAAGTALGAFAFPAKSKDSALVLDLPPGAYTATVSSAAGATGIALAEVYEVRAQRE